MELGESYIVGERKKIVRRLQAKVRGDGLKDLVEVGRNRNGVKHWVLRLRRRKRCDAQGLEQKCVYGRRGRAVSE